MTEKIKAKMLGWICTSCGHKMTNNPRYCPICTWTVYKPWWQVEDVE